MSNKIKSFLFCIAILFLTNCSTPTKQANSDFFKIESSEPTYEEIKVKNDKYGELSWWKNKHPYKYEVTCLKNGYVCIGQGRCLEVFKNHKYQVSINRNNEIWIAGENPKFWHQFNIEVKDNTGFSIIEQNTSVNNLPKI